MPNQPKTPARAVRVDDERWDKVKAEAAQLDETASDVVRRALDEHFAPKARVSAADTGDEVGG